MVQVQFNPIDPALITDPYPLYRALQEQGRILWSPVLESWIVTRYAEADAVLTDPRFSADRRKARNSFAELMMRRQEEFGPFAQSQTMLTSDPPEHTRLRRLVSKAFTPRAVENLRPRIEEIVEGILDSVAGRRTFDVVETLAYPLPVIVISEMLGVPPEDRARFKQWSDDVVATLGGAFAPPEVMERGRKAIEELAAYIGDVIAERRKEPRDDLISGLIAAEENGQVLSEAEIFATTILLLIAGNETTTNLIGNGLLALLQNPGELQTLREDLSLIPSAVEELLRYASPVQGTGRVAMTPLEIAGETVQEGQLVFLLLAAANRDPEKFADPDRLDVRRNPTDHLAFGDGIHFCLGAPLARAEAQIALRALLTRFPKIEQASEAQWGGTFIIRGVKHLELAVA
jgi:cytochrome P450